MRVSQVHALAVLQLVSKRTPCVRSASGWIAAPFDDRLAVREVKRAVNRAVNRAVIRAVMRAVKRSRRSQLAPCEQAR